MSHSRTNRSVPMAMTALVLATLLLATVSAGAANERPQAEPAGEPNSPTEVNTRLGTEVQISAPTTPECVRQEPKAAYDWVHRESLVVWLNEWSLDYKDIYAQRVTAAGELKSHFTISSGSYRRYSPDLAFNGTRREYLVVWSYDPSNDDTHYEIWGRLVAWDGRYKGPEFQILWWPNRAYFYPRVVWNSTRDQYLVVASVWDTANQRWNDVARRLINGDGSFAGSGGAVYQDPTVEPHLADVAYNTASDEYMVVWRQRWSGDDWDIYGARLRGDNAAVIDPPGAFFVDNTSVNQDYPAIVYNGGQHYLVVWQQDGGATSGWDIVGRELNLDGTWAEGPFDIFAFADDDTRPALASNWHSGEYLVVWRYAVGTGFAIRAAVLSKNSLGGPLMFGHPIAYGVTWTAPALAGAYPAELVVYGRDTPTARHIWGRTWAQYAVMLPIVQRNR